MTPDQVVSRVRAACLAFILVLGLSIIPAPAAAISRVHRVTLAMRDFTFQPGTLYFRTGDRVELVIQNRGAAEHEWSAGRGLVDTPYEKGFRTDLMAILKPRVSGHGFRLEQLMTANLDTRESVEGETVRRLSQEVDLDPGGYVVLGFTVPKNITGRWQMGCFLPGRYESGMYGDIRIE